MIIKDNIIDFNFAFKFRIANSKHTGQYFPRSPKRKPIKRVQTTYRYKKRTHLDIKACIGCFSWSLDRPEKPKLFHIVVTDSLSF